METNQNNKPKQVRWICPICNKGALAPTKPRMKDVRRYCLPCSKKEGVLIERTAPALERKRAARTQITKQKQTRKREQTKQAKMVAGFDVEKEAARLWKILCKQQNKNKPMPALNIVRRNRHGSSGYAYIAERKVSLQLGSGTVNAWEVVAHELVHMIGFVAHDKNFYHALKQLTEERWNTTISSFNWNKYGYACDRSIERQLTIKGCVKFK